MARKTYHEALNEVRGDVQKMAELAAEAVLKSVEALKASDMKAAKKIIKDDKKVNKLRFDIEEKCILLIATQQPMARDLRVLTAVINIITDIERIADHAEGIAKICVMLDGEPLVKPLVDIPRMAEIGVDMLRRCMIAFEEKDTKAAIAICADDDKVDDLYDQIYRELLRPLNAGYNRNIQVLTDKEASKTGASFFCIYVHICSSFNILLLNILLIDNAQQDSIRLNR